MINKVLQEFSDKNAVDNFISTIQNYNYCVIGGLAVSLYSNSARKVSPDDLDIYVDESQIKTLTYDLSKVGLDLIKSHVFQGSKWFVFSKGKSSKQVFDVAVKRSGSKYFKNLETFHYKNYKLKVISKENLVLNKLFARRDKDIRDLLYLLKNESNTFINLIYSQVDYNEKELLDQVIEDLDNFDTMVKVYG